MYMLTHSNARWSSRSYLSNRSFDSLKSNFRFKVGFRGSLIAELVQLYAAATNPLASFPSFTLLASNS